MHSSHGNGASGDDTTRRGGYIKSLTRLTSIDEQARILPHLRRQSYHLQKESTQHHNQIHLVVSYRACLHSSSLTAYFEHKSARCRYRLCLLMMVQARRWQKVAIRESALPIQVREGRQLHFQSRLTPGPLCSAPRTLHRARSNTNAGSASYVLFLHLHHLLNLISSRVCRSVSISFQNYTLVAFLTTMTTSSTALGFQSEMILIIVLLE